jgi:4-hydroxy-tetrahydrodipicolinate synthase
MNRDDVSWCGYWPAIVTPFTASGSLDEEGLRRVVDRVIADGAHGVCVNGSTGEWFSQTFVERRRVAEVAVAAVADRVPTVVAVTSSRVDDAVSLARHAAAVGATSVMSAPPPLARPTPRELEAYFREVFGAVSIPAWLYNFPQDNGHPMSVAELERLAAIPNVVAVKQSTPHLSELLDTIQRVGPQLRIFGTLIHRLGVAVIHGGFGGDGQVGSGMLLGTDLPEFFEATWRGDLGTAFDIADRHERLMAGLMGDRADGYNWAFGGMQPTLKAAMNALGQPGGLPRLPKLPIDDPEALSRLDQVLADAGLFREGAPAQPHGL